MAYLSRLFDFFKSRFILITWISLVIYLFYDTFTFYNTSRRFYHLRNILGLGLCTSRGTATVLNLCCVLILLPICKKLNQMLYQVLSRIWPGLFFFWLERAKSFHMTVAVTLFIFAAIHSISHFLNLWNFSRGYDEVWREINFANYKNQNPLLLLFSLAGLTGIAMLLIILSMGFTSTRPMRRRSYNAFWYTHQLYLPFLVLLVIHPLSGVLKEEIIQENNTSQNSSLYDEVYVTQRNTTKFEAIKSKTWWLMSLPLTCFFIDLIWRMLSRNLERVDILEVNFMPGDTMSIKMSCSPDLRVEMGGYVLLQCIDISLLEWHPFTVVQVPTSFQREFVVWIRAKGDWTEALQRLLLERGLKQLRMLVDGAFSSPMESVCTSNVAICVAAGVGITPFVTVLEHIAMYPRSRLPGRVHLLWIVRNEQEITWIAELATRTLLQLRCANRLDRLQIEFYVTSSVKEKQTENKNIMTHLVTINEKGGINHVLKRDESEKAFLLTPNIKRNYYKGVTEKTNDLDVSYSLAKEYPLIGCRVKTGRPHWDRVFGYWVHLYPRTHLKLFCCGPKKLVKVLRSKCRYYSNNTKTKYSFIHEGFS